MDRIGALSEVSDLVIGAGPVDLTTAAIEARWFNMRGCEGVNAILIAAIGTAGEDPIISLEQAQDASATGVKALTIRHLDYKIGSTGIDAADDLWLPVTTIDRDNPADDYDSDPIAGAENVLILSAFILPHDLDVAGNFTHIRMKVADTGAAAQLGVVLYIPTGRQHKGAHLASHLS